MSKNILIITGSPRRGGNTEKLAEAFAKGAQENKHTVTIFNAGTTTIQGCKACNSCWSKGRACSFTDGFTDLEPLLEQADVLVFASPLYWFTFTTQIKAAMDKLYAYVSEKALRPLAVKESALLVCGAADEEQAFTGTVETYKNIVEYMHWGNAGILIVPSVYEKKDVIKTNALQQAEELGRAV